jgi:D-amino-acid dehydrogenase
VKVVVMGAGLAGVTTAWYLAKDGHEVVVIDREPEIAAAASYANGGIIAASRAFPWSGGEIGRALRQSALRFDPAWCAIRSR